MKKYISFKAICVPICVVLMMSAFFFLQKINIIKSENLALIPFNFWGLKGVLFSPFLHADSQHLISNSIPMVTLLFMLYQFFGNKAHQIFIQGFLYSGLLLWFLPLFGFFQKENYSYIIGASGVVYMLAFFIFFSGIFRKDMKLLPLSLLIVLYYGSMIWGIFPTEWISHDEKMNHISWEAHLSGAIVGVLMAFFYRNKGEKKKKYIWEYPHYYSEKDDLIWKFFQEREMQKFNENH